MIAEWLACAALLGVAISFVLRKRRSAWANGRGIVRLTLLVAATAALGWNAATGKRSQSAAQMAPYLPRRERPLEYVSSDRCDACHPQQYSTWHGTFHRTMTQVAAPDTVLGDFQNARFELRGKKYELERRGDEFWVEMDDPSGGANIPSAAGVSLSGLPTGRVRKRVNLLTGSHHMQVYWYATGGGNGQVMFPFTWLVDDQRWVFGDDTFLRDPKIPPYAQTWNLNCINCHSTGGQPRAGARPGQLDTRVGELGIACEACHGMGVAHVTLNQSPLRRYAYHQNGQFDSTMVDPSRLPHQASSQVCGQCHGIKWIPNSEDWRQNGFRFRPGDDLDQTTPIVRPAKLETQPWLKPALRQNPRYVPDRYWSDGIVRVSGREFNAMSESACYQRGELSCLSCHSMHQSAPNQQMAASKESNEACFKCHEGFRAKLQEHTHHGETSSGSQCYNCHMPHTTYGLLKAIRSHYVENPDVRRNLQTGRPNGCNLCHLDRSLGWTTKWLSEWYHEPTVQLTEDEQNIAAGVLWLLRGDAGQRALVAWSMGWAPAQAASNPSWMAPFLGQLLEDPYAAVRYIALRSLRRIDGFHDLAYQFDGPPDRRAAGHQRALSIWQAGQPSAGGRTGSELLIGGDHALNQAEVSRLLQMRDDKSMDLQE